MRFPRFGAPALGVALTMAFILSIGSVVWAEDEDDDPTYYSCDLEEALCTCTIDLAVGTTGCQRMQRDECASNDPMPTCNFSKEPVVCSCSQRAAAPAD